MQTGPAHSVTGAVAGLDERDRFPCNHETRYYLWCAEPPALHIDSLRYTGAGRVGLSQARSLTAEEAPESGCPLYAPARRDPIGRLSDDSANVSSKC
ncbi:hypothetical protein GCM10023319_34620 [Nocardia iowensis]